MKRILGKAWATLVIIGIIGFLSAPSLAAGLPAAPSTYSTNSANPKITFIKITDGTTIKIVNTTETPLVLDKQDCRYEPTDAAKPVSINNDVKITADNTEINNAVIDGDLYIYGNNALLTGLVVKGTVYAASGSDITMDSCNIDPGNVEILDDDLSVSDTGSSDVRADKPMVALLESISIDDYNSRYIVANKSRLLPAGWKPKDLATISVPYRGRSEAKYLRKEAADALTRLFASAEKDRIKLCAISGFRSYELQKSVYYKYTKQLGEKTAEMVSAKPGSSEHQTGLSIDISAKSLNYALSNSFANTREGKWLARNAAEFGFILRYPKGREAITGYVYEPWHFRYIGMELAADITKKGMTLEEYYGLMLDQGSKAFSVL